MADVWVDLRAPRFVQHRHNATLHCDHNVDSESIYKVNSYLRGKYPNRWPMVPKRSQREIADLQTKHGTRWTDDLVKAAGTRWMEVASNRGNWDLWGMPNSSIGRPTADMMIII